MRLLGEIVRRVRMVAARARVKRELDDEMRLHVELREARLREQGMAGDDARVTARRRFGNVLRVREDSIDTWGWRWLDQIGQDTQFGLRTLARQPAFTATAIATLGLGIGASAALFSVVSGVLLRPLPFPEPERLVQIVGTSLVGGTRGDAVSNVVEIRAESTQFEAIAGSEVGARYLRRGDASERVMVVQAEQEFFAVLALTPLRGRVFGKNDSPDVAVVSERFWIDRLQGDPAVVGSVLTLNDRPTTIIGVMPASFQFPYGAASLLPGVVMEGRTDVWMPLGRPLNPRSRIGNVTARLKGSGSIGAARAELAAIASRLGAQYPETNRGRSFDVIPLGDAVVTATVWRPLVLLFGAVGIVLALACANVANLLLVRMTIRSREVAVRTALGASGWRLARQFLTESLLLTAGGGAVGLLIAWAATPPLLQMAGARLPRAHEVGFDWRVFLFLCAVSAVVGIVLGVAPAGIAARTGVRAVIQESGGHATMSGAHGRLRDGLVVAEVALAFVLAVGAALLIREMVRLKQTDIGLISTNVVTFHLGQRMSQQTDTGQFYEIADRVAALPGVRAAGFTQLLPLQSWGWYSMSTDFRPRGQPAPDAPPYSIELRYVTPGYFQAMGIAIRQGRGFTPGDTRDAPPVIMVNEALARRAFGDADPIGREMTRGTIVGIVADVRQVNLDRRSIPELYYPIAQNWSHLSELGLTLVVSARSRPDALVDAVRNVVRQIAPGQAIFDVKTMDRVVAESLWDFMLYLSLIALAAAVALALAAIGTYGVLSHIAASRARELAIRAALGADRARVIRLMLGQGLRLSAAGVMIGTIGALAAAPWLNGLPVAVRPPGVVTMVPVALLIGVVALVACLVPARRAAGGDLMRTLRGE